MDQACDAGMLFAILSGGECLLYPHFREIYDHLADRGVLVSVLTNGTLLDEEYVEWFSLRTPERIQISVYGSTPEAYRRVTGNASAFHCVDRAIDLLKQKKIPYELAITVSKNLVDDFESLLRYCISKEPYKCHVNTCPFDTRPETDRKFDAYAPSLDQQVAVFKTQMRVRNENMKGILPEKEDKPRQNPTQSETGVPCIAGQSSFAITWEGKMIPCSVFDYGGTFPLNTGFDAAWKELHQACLAYRNPIECQDCAYYSACRYCSAGHYLRMGEGHADPAVCLEAKRMVAEGIRRL